jgi:hypothetical protein
MKLLPKKGLYISTKKSDGMRFIVESVFGEKPDEFYLVEVIDEASKGDPFADGDEMDNKQWESLCAEYGLVFQSV